VENATGMDDGRLRSGERPAAVGFGFGKLDDGGATEVDVQRAGLLEDAAPDDLAGLAYSLQGAARGEESTWAALGHCWLRRSHPASARRVRRRRSGAPTETPADRLCRIS
jgi:hypothetical protein